MKNDLTVKTRSQRGLPQNGNRWTRAVALVCFVSTCAQAAVFSISDGIQGQVGNTVSVPVSFSDFATGTGMGFSVSWDQAILQYQSHSFNPALEGTKGANPLNDRIGVTYAQALPFGFNTSTVLLTVNFMAIGTGTSELNFIDSPTARTLSPTGSTASWDPGSVEVVPEPVNVALGIFAGIGIVGTGVKRWLKARRN